MTTGDPGTRVTVDSLLDHAPCGFLTFADDGSIRLINATLLTTLGYGEEELLGRHVEVVLAVGSRIFYHTHWFPLLRLHGQAEEIFLLLRTKGGDDVGMLVNGAAREGPAGTLYDCVLMRVNERRKYEDELLRARRAAEAAYAEAALRADEAQRANLRLTEQAVELEMQQHQLEEQAAVLEAASEELQTINELLLERTEEAEHLRQVAESANRAKSTFLAVMSHELRTPLNAIAGYVQLLEMGIHGPVTPAQLEALDRVARSQRHLLGLINDVLDLSRIEAGRVTYAIEIVSIAEMVDAVTPMIEPQLERKGLDLSVDVPVELLVRADREKVQQILINLVGNAVKFTPESRTIAIEAGRSAERTGEAEIRVRDTGIGIPPEKLDAVFEPFVQVEDRPAGGSGGSGLGLAISRDLARAMKGELRVRSVLGEGSTFTLTLPLA